MPTHTIQNSKRQQDKLKDFFFTNAYLWGKLAQITSPNPAPLETD